VPLDELRRYDERDPLILLSSALILLATQFHFSLVPPAAYTFVIISAFVKHRVYLKLTLRASCPKNRTYGCVYVSWYSHDV
jgi:hypothetical protein